MNRCDDCGRAVIRSEPIVAPDGRKLGPGCARKHGIRATRHATVRWNKPAGALSVFRRPPVLNARGVLSGEREPQPAPKWRPNPTALPGEIPLWPDDDTEGETT